MNDQNPYAAPQTSLEHDESLETVSQDTSGKPQDFEKFRVGSLLWLIGCVSLVVAIFWEDRAMIFGHLFVFLVATYLLTMIPSETPGRDWFSCSLVLQLISPAIAMYAIQVVPNPDWDRVVWSQRLAYWGEFLALFCVLVGLRQLASWLQFSLLRRSAQVAAFLLAFLFVFDIWARTQSFGYEGILYGLILLCCGFGPLFLLLLVCWCCALLVPRYAGLPLKPTEPSPVQGLTESNSPR
jgi:hypothetical protein